LLYRDIAGSVAFVALAFLSLFFFIDFVDAINRSAQRAFPLTAAALSTLLRMPGQLYELAPIAVLIGTIYALSRMAQASEFTVLRTAGLAPGRALRLLLLPGACFGLFTFALGEWVVPWSEQTAASLSEGVGRGARSAVAGTWMKDRGGSSPQAHNSAVHIAAALPQGELQGIRIFEFDRDNQLVRRIEAQSAQVDRQGLWQLSQVQITDWMTRGAPTSELRVTESRLDTFSWRGSLSDDVVAAAVLPMETMSTWDLWRYSRHLWSQEQSAQRYEIRFWKRALYPFSCLVMAALALPFAYLSARSGGVSLKVFGGVMLGISFALLNHLAGHIGLLRDWAPWAAAAAPALLYTALSLAAFGWLVRLH
jgi:lipopolysaccharide export system permease protein